jgi:para-nitrobenzyl esterase
VAALKWIKQNIAAFGGDPNNVTLFGQGSGAADVCYHMASARSRGLFQQAISESGGCTAHQYEEADVLPSVQTYKAQLGCTGSDVLDCLRTVRVENLLAAEPTSNSPFRPFVDGNFLAEQPRTAFGHGDIAKVAYILGSNRGEGQWAAVRYANVNTEAAYEAALQQAFPQDVISQVQQAYPYTNYTNTEQPYENALSAALGDAYMICPTWDTALRAYDAGASVYVYSFDATQAGGASTYGSELAYLFGDSSSLSESQKALRELVQTYWTNFATFGDPNGNATATWAKYTNVNKAGLSLAPQTQLIPNFQAGNCDMWRSLYDQQFTTAN